MKRVLVTGGARGFGRAIVEELAPKGYEIIATYFQSKEAADEIATKCPNVRFIEVDLRNRETLDSFVGDINKESLIDVLVSNAGIWIGGVFEKATKEDIYEQIDLNFTAPTMLLHGLLPLLKKAKSPLVINISSQAAHPVYPGEAIYSAVKSALSTLSQVLRTELNPHGIRVSTFEPWGVNTYGVTEPSGMILPQELAQVIRYVMEAPNHLQFDTINLSHIKQWRGEYPDFIEK